ncbi:MAG TPA: DUF6353 family protein [Paludibacteraceae bacterium]|nr:DUF6353 family protein [Paludibacteraceae bacterium]
MNAVVDRLKDAVTRPAFRTAVLGKKYSPQILIGVGIAGVVSATVLACRATIKAVPVLEEMRADIEDLHEIKSSLINEDVVKFDEKEYQKDLVKVYAKNALVFVKLYAPAFVIGSLSVAALIGSHGIMAKRNAALLAMYKGAEEAYSAYRIRVREELGDEREEDLFRGNKEEVVMADDGPHRIKKSQIFPTQYDRYFDESCKNWERNAEYNLLFLTHQQSYANDRLRARGHIMLNEVYDMLGFPRTKEGAQVGWVWKKGLENYVDFGMFEISSDKARDFVNGYEKAVLLHFNVQGVVWDLL